MSTESQPLRTLEDPLSKIRWSTDSPLAMTIETRQGEIRTRHGSFQGGRADGVEIIEVDTGQMTARILPTRGMALWDLEIGGVRFGWRSPVQGPVHPALVPINDADGLGWLEGFDELVVRCGLESNGAPEHDKNGSLKHPLHGRIGNLPADSLCIEFDEASGRLDVIGELLETKLFFKRLRLRSRIRFQAGSTQVDLLDDVTNELSADATVQMLYHINVGSPVLDEGAGIVLPVAELAPKDDRSAAEMDRWSTYDAPTPGYAERVYFAELQSDDGGETTALLHSSDQSRGLAVDYATKTLPRFIVWKNTAAEGDGYVTGLEPATNYPNTKGFEATQGRVVNLPSGESVSFRVTLRPLIGSDQVSETISAIQKLTDGVESTVHDQPKPGWSEG